MNKAVGAVLVLSFLGCSGDPAADALDGDDNDLIHIDSSPSTSPSSSPSSEPSPSPSPSSAEMDTTAPNLTISEPLDNSITFQGLLEVKGTCSDDSGIQSIQVNGELVSGDLLEWMTQVQLTAGLNEISITAQDNSERQNQTTKVVRVTLCAIAACPAPDPGCTMTVQTQGRDPLGCPMYSCVMSCSSPTPTPPPVLPGQTINDFLLTDSQDSSEKFKEASTAVALDDEFMFVASNEDETIRLYPRNSSGDPVYRQNFRASLGLPGSAPVDIEASSRRGNRIYWMGSHSNKKDGTLRPTRNRLFATDIVNADQGADAELQFVGFYGSLRTDLVSWDSQNRHGKGAHYYGFAAGTVSGKSSEATDGFNIEGLTVLSDGTGLIGFRAPYVQTGNGAMALIVPITNLDELVQSPTGGTAGTTEFGEPIEISLAGRGIRSLGACRNSNDLVMISGPAGDDGAMPPQNYRLFKRNLVNDLNFAAHELAYTFEVGLSPEGFIEESCSSNLTATTLLQLVFDNGGGPAEFLTRILTPGSELN